MCEFCDKNKCKIIAFIWKTRNVTEAIDIFFVSDNEESDSSEIRIKTLEVHIVSKSHQKKKKELNFNSSYCYFALLVRLTTLEVCLLNKIAKVVPQSVIFDY